MDRNLLAAEMRHHLRIGTCAGGGITSAPQIVGLRVVAILQSLATASVGFTRQYILFKALWPAKSIKVLEQLEQRRGSQFKRFMREQMVATDQHRNFAIGSG